MSNVGKVTIFVLAIALALAAAFMGGRWSAPSPALPEPQCDTIRIIDTIYKDKMVYIDRIVLDSIKVTDTVLVKEKRVYQDSTFKAVVSGVSPVLESIELYRPQTIINKVQYVTAPEKRHHISVGIDAAYCKQFMAPVYVSYEYKYRCLRPNISAGYDIVNKSAYAQVGIKVTLEY